MLENQEQSRIIEEQSKQINELQSQLSEFSNSLPEHLQQIDEIESSFAKFYTEIDDKIDSIPSREPIPKEAFLTLGAAALIFLLALGLDLEGQIGKSRIIYKGEGITSVLVQGLMFAFGGGMIKDNIKPIGDFFSKKR